MFLLRSMKNSWENSFFFDDTESKSTRHWTFLLFVSHWQTAACQREHKKTFCLSCDQHKKNFCPQLKKRLQGGERAKNKDDESREKKKVCHQKKKKSNKTWCLTAQSCFIMWGKFTASDRRFCRSCYVSSGPLREKRKSHNPLDRKRQ